VAATRLLPDEVPGVVGRPPTSLVDVDLQTEEGRPDLTSTLALVSTTPGAYEVPVLDLRVS
jgi:hypothetical protein